MACDITVDPLFTLPTECTGILLFCNSEFEVKMSYFVPLLLLATVSACLAIPVSSGISLRYIRSLQVKTFEGTITTGYEGELYQIELTPDGDMLAFYSNFAGPDDENYPAFVKFDAKTGTQQMAYWYNVTSIMESNIGTVDKDGNIWIAGFIR
jgi:hypothetical protein